MLLLTSTTTFAQANEKDYDFNNPTEEIRYGVDQISRICPTFIWDSWTFIGLDFNKEKNTVTMTLQLKDKSEQKKSVSSEKIYNRALWIIENMIGGYEITVANNSVFIDGDFMLYLSVGKLLECMTVTNTNLEIVILKGTGEKISPSAERK